MTIGKRINMLCEEKNIKQKELAERIGVTEATMSRYINDKRIPKGEFAVKMANILGVTTEYLMGVSDIRTPTNTKKERFSKEAETIAAHLEDKNITPQKLKLLKNYIDALFEEEF